MRAYMDLHIHSVLSPCAEGDMTPNNIVNMAWLKELDIIAVTDHNAAENCSAVLNCAKKRGILAVPGMEVETREEVHILCLLPDLKAASEMQERIWHRLPESKNRADIFGEQQVMNDEDQVVDEVERMLVTAANIGVEEIFAFVESLGGVAIPAHVDRSSYSIISNLGFIPEDVPVHFIEISRQCDPDVHSIGKVLHGKYPYLRTSDAHRLEDILEREFYLELDEISVPALFRTLRGCSNSKGEKLLTFYRNLGEGVSGLNYEGRF